MSQIKFNGKILREPQAASRMVVGIPPKANPLATGRVIVLGTSEGGEPNKVLWFSDKSEAKEVLRSGDALREIGYIFNPSPQHDGAPAVGFIRSQVAVQGSLTKGSIKFTAKDYGLWTNVIKIKVENGTAGSTTSKVTINYVDKFEIADNLGHALSIQSVTPQAFVEVYYWNGTTKIIGKISDGEQPPAFTEVFSFDFSLDAYNTISKVAKAINDVADWSCSINANAPAGAGALDSSCLDVQGSTGCTSQTDLAAYPYMVQLWVNTNSEYVTASIETAGTKIINTTGYEFLAGGSASDWDVTTIGNALTAIREENCQVVFIDSTSAAHHALVDAHCRNDAENERIAVFGGDNKATKALALSDAIDKAKVLNSARSILVACGISDFTVDGSGTEAISPKYFAAKITGLIAGLPVQEPLTHKVFSCTGIQYNFTKAEREQLINAGVLAPRYYEGLGFIVNQGVNTLQNNLNLWDGSTNSSPEISLTRASDQVSKELRVAADKQFIGGTVGIGHDNVVAFVENFLNEKEADGIIAGNDSDPNNVLPSWENVIATRLDDGWHVKYSVRFNNPFNFFLIETVSVI